MSSTDTTSLPQIRKPSTAEQVECVTVGTDGSYWGGMALDWAARHAWTRGAKLHVLRDPSHQPADVPSDLGLSHTTRRYPLLQVSSEPTSTTPLADFAAASVASDLFVLGCRGHQHHHMGLGDLVVPAVVGAYCDVLLVRGTPEAVRGSHRRVTAMVSGGAHDAGVLRRAAEVAATYRSRLRVVHAAVEGLLYSQAPDNVLRGAELRLKAMRCSVHTTFSLMRALPHEVLVRDNDTDLVVLCRGQSHWHTNNPGPVAKAALYHAACPVLVTRL